MKAIGKGRALWMAWGLCVLSGAAAAQEAPLSEMDVVASRGGVKLTVGLVDQEVDKMPDAIRADYLADPSRFARLVDTLLLTKQLGVAALQQGLEVPQEYRHVVVDNDLAALTAMGNRLLRQQEVLRSQGEYERIASERYRARKANYATEETFVLREILIDRKIRGDIAAKLIAEDVRARAVSGESFLALRSKFGDELDGVPSQEDLTITISQLLRAPEGLKKALLSIGRGEGISEAIAEPDFYRIVQVIEYLPGKTPPFEELKERIVEEIRAETIANAKTTLMRSFSLQDVELIPDVVQRLASRYADDSNPRDDAESGARGN